MPLTLAANSIVFDDTTTLSPSNIKWETFASAGFALASNKKYLANTTTTPLTAILPLTPSNGDFIIIADSNGRWDINNLTINRNGNLINDQSRHLICDVRYIRIELVFNGTTWCVS
jgi:hypothetical protein